MACLLPAPVFAAEDDEASRPPPLSLSLLLLLLPLSRFLSLSLLLSRYRLLLATTQQTNGRYCKGKSNRGGVKTRNGPELSRDSRWSHQQRHTDSNLENTDGTERATTATTNDVEDAIRRETTMSAFMIAPTILVLMVKFKAGPSYDF